MSKRLLHITQPQKPRSLMWIFAVLSIFVHLILINYQLFSLLQTAPAPPKVKPLTAQLSQMKLDMPAPMPSVSMPEPKTLRKENSSEPVAEVAPKPVKKQLPKSSPAPQAKSSTTVVTSEPSVVTTNASAPASDALASLEVKLDASVAAAQTISTQAPVMPDLKITEFPQTAVITFEGFYGKLMAGYATITFERDAQQYRLNVQVKPVLGKNIRFNVQGHLDSKLGLLPDRYEAYRNNELRDFAEFDYAAQLLKFGEANKRQQVELKPGAQDVLSLGFQLALKGAQLGKTPTQITTGRKVYDYPIEPLGEVQYDTKAGPMRAVVVRAQDKDNLNEYWLAADFANLPIRILRTDAKYNLELRAIEISVDGISRWKRPPEEVKQKESKNR